MKKTFLCLPLLLIITAVFSQRIFTGKVIYRFKSEKNDETGIMEVYYGDQKIRGIKLLDHPKHDHDDADDDDDDLLIDFSKALIYNINTGQKIYRIDKIKAKSIGGFPLLVAEPSKNTIILKQHCSAFTINDKTSFTDNLDFVFLYADSLYFPLNEKQLLLDEMALFTNGKTIGMGTTITRQVNGKKNSFGLTPLSIEAGPVPDSLFEMPKDYIMEITEHSLQADTAMAAIMAADSTVKKMMDSAARMMDSIIKTIDPPKTPAKKSVPKSTKNKAPVKAAAVRRKE